MANEAALVARLEARMDKYEKAMKGAEETADRTVKGIENTFASTTIGTTLGNIISKALLGAVEAGLKIVQELIEKFQKLEKTAELTGLTIQEAFAIDKVLGAGGSAGLERVATLLDRMQRGESNFLSKLFDENGVKNVKEAGDAFTHVVDIIARLPNLIQAREAGSQLGISSETVDRIREVGSEFVKLRDAAAAAGPNLDALAAKAREFEKMWKDALDAVKAYLVDKFHEMAVPVAEFLQTSLNELSALLKGLGLLGDVLRLPTEAIRDADNNIKTATKSLGEFIAKAKEAPMVLTVGPSGNASKLPPLGGGAKSGGVDRLDALEREQRRATERTAQMELEGKLIGQNVETRSRELEILRLTQMAEREKIPLTEAVRMKIDEQAEAYGRAAGKLDELMRKSQQSLSLQNFAGNMLVDSLMKATEAGAKFSDIMADISRSIARAALQALILGQGPLAGLFGTAPTASGQTGGLIGGFAAALKALPKYASGGVVPGTGPVPIMAHGGEVVVPKAVAQSSVGGGPIMITQTIDARGAQLGVGDQIAAALAANNRALQVTLPSMIRNASSRGSVR